MGIHARGGGRPRGAKNKAPAGRMIESCYDRVGHGIRFYRCRAGLTQGDIASQLDITRASVANIEMGRQRVQLHTLVRIAEILRVDVCALFTVQAAKPRIIRYPQVTLGGAR